MALTYGEISSITEKYFVPKLVDNIFDSNTLFQRMRSGKMMATYGGGERILQPVMYATTTASGSYQGADTLDTTSNDQITAAEFEMKQYYANITITRQDELKNSGDAQIIDFVKSKVQIAEKTLADNMGTDLYGTGTGDAIIGLGLAVDSAGTYGGINRTTYTWWSAQEDSTTTVLSLAAMQAIYGDATVGNDKPTVAFTTQDVFDDYHGLLTPQERYVDSKTADAGFTSLMFRSVPVIVDSHCGSGDIYFLNENYLKLYNHSKENFRFEPFTKPVNQNVASAKIYWAGALACSNCRMQAKMTAIA